MLDGIYGIQMRTLLGWKKGTLTLRTQGGLLSGVLEILGNRNPIADGIALDNRCRFRGEIRTALGSVAYEAEGEVDGDTLTALSRTSKGDLQITGTRLTEP